MSTKTTFKRVALVAAVAAAFAGVSTVAANAAATATATFQATAGYSNASAPAASTAATANAVSDGNHYVTVKILASHNDSGYSVTSSGVGSIYGSATVSQGPSDSTVNAVNSNGTNAGAGFGFGPAFPSSTVFAASTSTTVTFSVVSATAGTQTITATPINGTSAASTLTITWGAAPVLSAANSKVAMLSTNTTGNWNSYATDSTILASSAYVTPTASNFVAAIRSISNDNESTPAPLAGDTISATITGPGLLTAETQTVTDTVTASPALAGARVASATTGAAGAAFFFVYADGTAGTSTITISDGTTVLGTKTVTFYGTTQAAIAATANLKVAAAGTTLGAATAGTASSGAITVSLKDSSGNLSPAGSAPTIGTSTGNWYATSSNTTCISSTIPTNGVVAASTGGDGVGYYEINIAGATGATSGCTASVTVSYVVSSTVTLTSAPITFAVGGTTIAALALTTDAATYAPGQKVTYTLTAKDSSGNAVADGAYGVFATHNNQAAISGLTANAALVVAPFAAAATTGSAYNDLSIIGGVATSTTYAPYYSGNVTTSNTLPSTDASLATALLGTAVTSSFAVTSPTDSQASAATDAANEATDAANAATDAANAAADAADAATAAAQDASAQAQAALAAVNALSAKITVLAAQIAKIIKKLGA
jgi:hypothetical protein